MTKIVSCYFCGTRFYADDSVQEPFADPKCGKEQFFLGLEQRDRVRKETK